MNAKITLNYSPNFSSIRRIKKNIKFLIFHYTGMKSESKAINRLIDVRSKVSSHYFIRKNGKIISMVPERYVAWHAGESYWEKYKSLNDYSIGIEIQNKGHRHGYENFNKKQIYSLSKISKFLIKKYGIKKKNILGHSDIAYWRKTDPGEKFPWKKMAKLNVGLWHNINRNLLIKNRKIKILNQEKLIFFKYLKKIGYYPKINKLNQKTLMTKAFQRRFRPELINGKVDKECLKIAKKLSKI